MKAYKGFNKDMTCRGFQYAEGGEYETDEADVCDCGFHACENPLDCFAYYDPSDEAVFHEVELGGDIQRGDSDTKCAATKIKIGARLTIAGMVKAGLGFVFSKAKKLKTPAATSGSFSTSATSGFCSPAATSGDRSTAAASGDRSTAATSGTCSTAATSGSRSTAAASGDLSTAATSGNGSIAATSGSFSTAAASCFHSKAATSGGHSTAAISGNNSIAATSGNFSTAATSGDCSTAATSGDFSMAEVSGNESVAVATGFHGKARGSIGNWLVLTERAVNWHILDVRAICIDGKRYKADTWYALKNGKIIKA